MKKALVILSLLQIAALTSCGRPQVPGMAGPVGMQPGLNDPYAGGYAQAPLSDPYGGGYAQAPLNDPYGGGYAQPGFNNDPYGAGYGNGGYAQAPLNDPYGTGAGYGNGGFTQSPGFANGQFPQNGQLPNGQQMTIDPVTGQPMPAMSVVSQQIISEIQAAGGYRARKADDVVRDKLKGISIAQALGQAPLDHRSTIIKTLLDGYAGEEDRNYAMQVWNTILPQDQQNLMAQDSTLSKLVKDKLLKNSSGGIRGVLSEAGKFIGLSK